MDETGIASATFDLLQAARKPDQYDAAAVMRRYDETMRPFLRAQVINEMVIKPYMSGRQPASPYAVDQALYTLRQARIRAYDPGRADGYTYQEFLRDEGIDPSSPRQQAISRFHQYHQDFQDMVLAEKQKHDVMGDTDNINIYLELQDYVARLQNSLTGTFGEAGEEARSSPADVANLRSAKKFLASARVGEQLKNLQTDVALSERSVVGEHSRGVMERLLSGEQVSAGETLSGAAAGMLTAFGDVGTGFRGLAIGARGFVDSSPLLDAGGKKSKLSNILALGTPEQKRQAARELDKLLPGLGLSQRLDAKAHYDLAKAKWEKARTDTTAFFANNEVAREYFSGATREEALATSSEDGDVLRAAMRSLDFSAARSPREMAQLAQAAARLESVRTTQAAQAATAGYQQGRLTQGERALDLRQEGQAGTTKHRQQIVDLRRQQLAQKALESGLTLPSTTPTVMGEGNK